MKTVQLFLTDEQIGKLINRAVATGESADDWQLMAQALLNQAIGAPVFDETEIFDGADCPFCGHEESVHRKPNSGRDDEGFLCDECDYQWYIVRRIV